MAMSVRDRAPARDRLPSVSVALLATAARRRALIPRLAAVDLACHVLLLQCDREDELPPAGRPVLPPIQGPLLVDTIGLTPVMQIRVLDELARRFADVPTLILTTPTDRVLHRLAASCPAVYAVAAETTTPAELLLWLRHCGAVGPHRRAQVLPAYLGLEAPSIPVVDPALLAILAALAQAQSIEAATALSPLPDRTFYRKLAAVRAALHVPARMYRGRAGALLQTLLEALAASPARA